MMKLAPAPASWVILALTVPALLGGCAGESRPLARSWDGYAAESRNQAASNVPGNPNSSDAANSPIADDVPDYNNVPGLSNTHWRLAEIQEANTGISRPDDPAKYTFSFGSDGIVLMRLNCNEARGPWTAQPQEMSQNGLSIGPLDMTPDACEPPSLDEQIKRDMEFVRSYRLQGDRLYLNLLADDATYVLERIEPLYGTQS